jgi:hypothetical protein
MQRKSATPPAPRAPATAPRAEIKPFDSSSPFLFTPAATYRTHYVAMSNRPDWPEYPAVGARIEYYLPAQTDVTLEILDSGGTVVRRYTSRAASAPARGGRRGAALPTRLPNRAGTNRFVWDLRYPGVPVAGDEESGSLTGGPLVPPGAYRARLTAGGVSKTEPFTVKIDPRYAKDGVTVADLAEQARFALKVRDAIADGRALAERVRKAIDARSGDESALQALYARLVTKSGPYEDEMWIDQMSNVAREVGQADQKVGASAVERYDDLMKEWAQIRRDARSAGL